ncbi:MAG: NHLP bacteriocin export ABC transporter permease/ATPase subunit [Limisphaerales bacterium]
MAVELANLFASEGTRLEVGSNQPVRLNDPASVWLIDTGKVDVFAIPVQPDGQAGSRYHFFRAEPGQLLFGLSSPPAAPGPEFLAVGSSGTCLYQLPLNRLKNLAGDPALAQAMSRSIDRWIELLYAGLARSVPPTQSQPLEPGLEIEMEARVDVRPWDGVVWVKLGRGSALLAAVDALRLAPDQGFVPIAASTWLHATEETTLSCAGTADLLNRDLVWSSLIQFYALVGEWMAANLAQDAASELARLQSKADAQRRAVTSAVSGLSSLLRPAEAERDAGGGERDLLLGACQLIGRALGVTVKLPAASRPGRTVAEPLETIAKASRLRVRRVVLDKQWWSQDSGPLLGFLRDTDQPVALLPASADSYEIVDPADHTRQTVTPAAAQLLQPLAYTFYRPFAARALRLRDVLSFGLRNCGPDLNTILWIGVAGGLLGMLVPIVTGIVFDSIIPAAEHPELVYSALALLVAAFASVIFQITRSIALLRLEGKSEASLQAAVWDRLLSLPIPFFRNYSSGDLAMRVNGVNAIRGMLSGAVTTSVLSGVFSVFNFALLFYYSMKLALIATMLVVVSVAMTAAASLLSLRYQRPLYRLQGKISGLVLQFITGISKLRVAGAEVHAYAVWARDFSAQKKIDLKAGTVFNAFIVFHEIYPIITTMGLFGAMAFWMDTGLSTGKFLAFSSAFGAFLFAMLEMSSSLISILNVVPVYERAKPILETLPEVDEGKSDPGDLQGKIELSHVAFRYKADGPLVLQDLSFQINPGEFVAIVGPSGSGKSTLMRLLLGFETPESGTIYYDGLDLAGLDVQAVRRQLGVVLQGGKLMPGDIYQNIVGASSLTVDDAWEAARKAGFDDDVREMPMGMHTVLSEGGGTLSGGQRQRLMIARAIVSRPRILLFDEATSALDNHTQAIVSKSLAALQATRIVIAHRLSTIINADRIFVVQAGRLVQAGHYDELMRQSGPFAELARRQLA